MAGDFTSADRAVGVPASSEIDSASGTLVSNGTSAAELWQSGRYRELSSLLKSDLSHAETVGDRQLWVNAANNLACTRRAAGDHESAAYFQLLAATAERQPMEGQPGRISAASLGNLACDALLSGRLAIAESLLWKSLLAELAAGNNSGIAADWANLGLLAGLLGEFDAAKARLWWALKLHRRLGDAYHLGLDLWHLAQLFEIDGDWQQAHRLYGRAAQWFATADHAELHQSASHKAVLNAARAAVLAFDAQLN